MSKEVTVNNMLMRYEWNGSGYSWYVYRDRHGRRESATTEQIIKAQRLMDDRREINNGN